MLLYLKVSISNCSQLTKYGNTLAVREGGKHVCCQTSLQSLLTALSFSRSGKRSELAFKTSVQPDYWWQGPRDLPACTSLFWTADPNTLHLLEWHVAAILKGGSSATPLMSTTVSKAGKPFSLLSVFHLDKRFFYSGEGFLKWSRQRTDLHGLDSYAVPGVSKTVTEDCSKAVHWEPLVNREHNEVVYFISTGDDLERFLVYFSLIQTFDLHRWLCDNLANTLFRIRWHLGNIG